MLCLAASSPYFVKFFWMHKMQGGVCMPPAEPVHSLGAAFCNIGSALARKGQGCALRGKRRRAALPEKGRHG
jgi:hypothetical protein